MIDANQSLSDVSNSDRIDNIVIFISDSTRYDVLLDSIAEQGVSGRMIAPSTYTASSVPSILTGRHPVDHAVWGFNDQLSQTPLLFRLVEHTGYRADTIWTHLDPIDKPPLRINRISPGAPITSIDEPFVYVEHDKGGHAPYGHSFSECKSVREYYTDYVNEPDEVFEQYQRSITNACERFTALIRKLKKRGLFNRTLIIFTADHGELLGESKRGHVYGHAHPMTPELVEVPVVFCGAGLPEMERYPEPISGVDIAPTALTALDYDIPRYLSGRDLWMSPPSSQAHRCDVWMQTTRRGHTISYYAATSLWSKEGGIVSHIGSRAVRTASAQYFLYSSAAHSQLARRQWSPRSYLNLLQTYAPSQVSYGNIDQTLLSCNHTLPTDFTNDTRSVSRERYDREQLEDLGYL